MSTEIPTHESRRPDEDAVRRARAEIQSLVEEVYTLSRSDADPSEFFAGLLERSVSALAAIGGVVWTIEEGGPFKLEHQINLQQTGLIGDENAQQQHGRLLQQAVKRGDALIVPPHSGSGVDEGEGPPAANPTSFLLVMAPIHTDRGVDGLLEIFQRTGARPDTQRGYLKFLQQMCELAGDYLKSRRLRHYADKQTLWEQLESFTSLVHHKLDSRETAYTIANEGRRLIGCDRVTVVLRKGPKYVVEAISGQDTFDKRSNAVRLLRNLAAVVAKSGEDLWYSGETADLSPQVEKAVNAYVDESHTKQLAVLPIRESNPNADDKTRPKQRENMLGAIVIEQLVDSKLAEGLLQRVDVVRRHSSAALTNAQSHEQLFLLPVWRTIGKSRVMVEARNLPKTVAAAIALTAVGLALWLAPYDFTVVADGKLQPEVRRNVFAALDGMVVDVPVEDGQAVAKGDLLARQQSLELETELTRLSGEIQQNVVDLAAAERQRRQLQAVPQTRDVDLQLSEVTSEIARLKTVGESLVSQQKLKQRQERQLRIVSPIDGKVVTWKVQDLIGGRPVKTGQRLMEIADPSQAWELEVDVPEAKMGHIVTYLNKLKATDPTATLDVTFILATHPSVKLSGKVTQIHSSAEVAGEKGNAVRMDVAFDQNELLKLNGAAGSDGGAAAAAGGVNAEQAVAELKKSLKVGADVKAKVHCGKASVGYVLFHDAWEFFQSRVLFRL